MKNVVKLNLAIVILLIFGIFVIIPELYHEKVRVDIYSYWVDNSASYDLIIVDQCINMTSELLNDLTGYEILDWAKRQPNLIIEMPRKVTHAAWVIKDKDSDFKIESI